MSWLDWIFFWVQLVVVVLSTIFQVSLERSYKALMFMPRIYIWPLTFVTIVTLNSWLRVLVGTGNIVRLGALVELICWIGWMFFFLRSFVQRKKRRAEIARRALQYLKPHLKSPQQRMEERS